MYRKPCLHVQYGFSWLYLSNILPMGLIYVLHELGLEYITNKISPSSVRFLPHIGYACKHVLQRQALSSTRKKCCWHGWLNWWSEKIKFFVDYFCIMPWRICFWYMTFNIFVPYRLQEMVVKINPNNDFFDNVEF